MDAPYGLLMTKADSKNMHTLKVSIYTQYNDGATLYLFYAWTNLTGSFSGQTAEDSSKKRSNQYSEIDLGLLSI
ncbi:MAG: hypothetical protein EOP45_21295 [Sphingobacteriaceae bacterium]|nr:MAG: hypothetical protein EOP45_21295 [Sphingobacteriaceae bacterium]